MHGTSIFSKIFIKNDSLMKYVNIGIGPKRGVECLNAPEHIHQSDKNSSVGVIIYNIQIKTVMSLSLYTA